MSERPAIPALYDLYAVLVHSGHSVHSGHYYSYVRAPNGIWHICDDTHVAQVGPPPPAPPRLGASRVALTHAFPRPAWRRPHAGVPPCGTATPGTFASLERLVRLHAHPTCPSLRPPPCPLCQVAERQVMAQKAYILFYKKRQPSRSAPPLARAKAAPASAAAPTPAALRMEAAQAALPLRRQDVQQQQQQQLQVQREGPAPAGPSAPAADATAAAGGILKQRKRRAAEDEGPAAAAGELLQPPSPHSDEAEAERRRQLPQNGHISKKTRLKALKRRSEEEGHPVSPLPHRCDARGWPARPSLPLLGETPASASPLAHALGGWPCSCLPSLLLPAFCVGACTTAAERDDDTHWALTVQ